MAHILDTQALHQAPTTPASSFQPATAAAPSVIPPPLPREIWSDIISNLIRPLPRRSPFEFHIAIDCAACASKNLCHSCRSTAPPQLIINLTDYAIAQTCHTLRAEVVRQLLPVIPTVRIRRHQHGVDCSNNPGWLIVPRVLLTPQLARRIEHVVLDKSVFSLLWRNEIKQQLLTDATEWEYKTITHEGHHRLKYDADQIHEFLDAFRNIRHIQATWPFSNVDPTTKALTGIFARHRLWYGFNIVHEISKRLLVYVIEEVDEDDEDDDHVGGGSDHKSEIEPPWQMLAQFTLNVQSQYATQPRAVTYDCIHCSFDTRSEEAQWILSTDGTGAYEDADDLYF